MDKLIQMAREHSDATKDARGRESLCFDEYGLAAFRDAVLADAGFAALVAERDALREDALRYRWLRHNSSHYVFDSAWIGITAVKEGRCHIFSADEVPALLDAEIDRRRLARTSLDAAIAAGGQP